jgi:hypothetical protein
MASGYASPGSVITMSVVLPVLSVAAVSLRMYTRKRQKQPLLLDDWYVPSFTPRIQSLTTKGFSFQHRLVNELCPESTIDSCRTGLYDRDGRGYDCWYVTQTLLEHKPDDDKEFTVTDWDTRSLSRTQATVVKRHFPSLRWPLR